MKIGRKQVRIIVGTLMLFTIVFTVVFGGIFMTDAEERAWLDRIGDNPYLAYDIMNHAPNPPGSLVEIITRGAAFLLIYATILIIMKREVR